MNEAILVFLCRLCQRARWSLRGVHAGLTRGDLEFLLTLHRNAVLEEVAAMFRHTPPGLDAAAQKVLDLKADVVQALAEIPLDTEEIEA